MKFCADSSYKFHDQLACQSGMWKSPGGIGRTLLFRGSSTSVSIPDTALFVSMTYDLGGRGNMQYFFDLTEASAFGLRIYNRGGENADRPYDAVFSVSKSGSNWVISGQNSWGGTPVIKSVTGFY